MLSFSGPIISCVCIKRKKNNSANISISFFKPILDFTICCGFENIPRLMLGNHRVVELGLSNSSAKSEALLFLLVLWASSAQLHISA